MFVPCPGTKPDGAPCPGRFPPRRPSKGPGERPNQPLPVCRLRRAGGMSRLPPASPCLTGHWRWKWSSTRPVDRDQVWRHRTQGRRKGAAAIGGARRRRGHDAPRATDRGHRGGRLSRACSPSGSGSRVRATAHGSTRTITSSPYGADILAMSTRGTTRPMTSIRLKAGTSRSRHMLAWFSGCFSSPRLWPPRSTSPRFPRPIATMPRIRLDVMQALSIICRLMPWS